jgi:predicted dehydrogenase
LRLVFDRDPERATRVLSELPQAKAAPSFEAVLADPLVDIVSIASYDDDHFGQVMAALAAGKHVFCEKPLCLQSEQLAQIEAAWTAARGCYLASNLVLRSAPLYRWLKQAIAAGELGEIYAFDGDYLYGRVHKIVEGWRAGVDAYSVMLGGGVHLVDLMLWLTGQKPDSVGAMGNRISTRGSAFRYLDFVAASFGFPSGMVGRITANFGCVHKHQHVVRVFGTKATFVYDDQGPRLHRSRGPEDSAESVAQAALPSGKGDLIPELIDAIADGRDWNAQTRQEFDVIAACLAADRAIDADQRTRIRYQ